MTSFLRQVSGASQCDCEIPSFLNMAFQGSSVNLLHSTQYSAKFRQRRKRKSRGTRVEWDECNSAVTGDVIDLRGSLQDAASSSYCTCIGTHTPPVLVRINRRAAGNDCRPQQAPEHIRRHGHPLASAVQSLSVAWLRVTGLIHGRIRHHLAKTLAP